MGKTLYLHIGTPKTATTAIQMFCEENQEVLNKKNYSYPVFPIKYPRVRLRRNAHFLVGRIWDNGKRNLEKEKEIRDQGFALLEKEFEKYDNVILSDENIWHSTAFYAFESWKILKEFLDAHGYGLKAIVYLRRQDNLLTSWLNQQIQDGWDKNGVKKWEDYIKNPTDVVIDYYSHLERISEVIGKENMAVRIFDQKNFEGKGNTIQSDFLKVIGLEMTDDFFLSDEKDNVTMSLNACEVKRIINGMPDNDNQLCHFMKRVTERVALVDPKEYKSEWFSPEERKEFLEGLKESNEKIAREYLHREDGILFDMDIKQAEKWDPHNPYMYEDVIRFFGEAVFAQQKEIVDLNEKIKKQQQKIHELEQTSFWFRLRRKWRHITGQDKK